MPFKAPNLGKEEEIAQSRALEPERDPEEILVEITRGEGDALLVGHQPHLGALLGMLIAGRGVEIAMKKASVARVTIEGRWSGTLRAYLPPRILEALAAKK